MQASLAARSSASALVASRPRRTVAAARPRVVLARAEVKAPQNVTQPPAEPKLTTAKYGFVDNAERINSRAAMLGFFGILLVEFVTGKGIFELVGIPVGNGLGFSF